MTEHYASIKRGRQHVVVAGLQMRDRRGVERARERSEGFAHIVAREGTVAMTGVDSVGVDRRDSGTGLRKGVEHAAFALSQIDTHKTSSATDDCLRRYHCHASDATEQKIKSE